MRALSFQSSSRPSSATWSVAAAERCLDAVDVGGRDATGRLSGMSGAAWRDAFDGGFVVEVDGVGNGLPPAVLAVPVREGGAGRLIPDMFMPMGEIDGGESGLREEGADAVARIRGRRCEGRWGAPDRAVGGECAAMQIRSVPSIAHFAEVARGYCSWCEGESLGPAPQSQAASWLARLYAAALALPERNHL